MAALAEADICQDLIGKQNYRRVLIDDVDKQDLPASLLFACVCLCNPLGDRYIHFLQREVSHGVQP